MEKDKKLISEYFRKLAKKMHKKNPRSKEFYSRMGKARWAKRKPVDK